ncbi:hypothetical protein GOP47_0021571 [Adiantum capillus-veneris]|uniref:Uncharacterized protein n=1 Tax=Adiantum capillus-veneris TaxID=13818 RepID=A0A9D4Z6D7_ADICA|nr:hypothetical protein GOP47_0021571 [Adiantum capillus-veneris]
MNSLALLQRHLCLSSRKIVERHLGHAKKLLLSNEQADIYCALNLLDTALKLSPQSEKAIELKARALLCLRRFQDVANLLHEFIPSLKTEALGSGPPFDTEKVKLLEGHPAVYKTKVVSNVRCFSLFPSKGKLWVTFSRKGEREQWRRAASAAIRKQSTSLREDDFIVDSMFGPDSDVVSHLLHSIKYLLRRRAAALASLEAGIYLEAARHLSKIIDGRRGTPQAFIAECCLYRAMAYHAANRYVDAIADCNRCLALDPMCAEALDIRATIYEIIGCFDDCLENLDQLKALYASGFQNDKSMRAHRPSIVETDFQGLIDSANSRLAAVRERWNIYNTIDHHRILGVSRGCTRAEAERAFVVLSLKHRPDKVAHFIDRCEFVDDRKIEDVKEQARLMGSNLFQLIEKAYTGVLTLVMEEEMRRDMKGGLNDLVLGKAACMVSFWEDSRDMQQKFPEGAFCIKGEASSLVEGTCVVG